MKTIKERILYDLSVKPYFEHAEHKDLVLICICSEYFMDYEDENNNITPDFNEVIAIIEKDWLFTKMKREGIKNPLKYLQEEYTSEDSINWYNEALEVNKVVMVSFN